MEEVTLRDLIRKRGALKAQLTLFKKFHTQFENAMQDASLADIEKARIIELELRVVKNERMFQEFDQVQTQIEAQSDDLDAQMIERDNFKTTFYAIISSCKRYIEEQTCEEIFRATTRRDKDGRFIVRVPLKLDPSHLGQSKEGAIKRFHSMENKLSKNPIMRESYVKFMDEYDNLGHMIKVSPDKIPSNSYFLPHHPVVNENNKTTKLRVVFDASARTDSGYSLIDLQYVGPTIQDTLFSILLRFRQGPVAIGADLLKMFRQVKIAEDQRHLQTILWRANLMTKPPEAEKINFIQMRSVHAKPDMSIFKEHRVFVKFELFGMASRAG
nr:unnamed protein product [Callosobruchus chinensis]